VGVYASLVVLMGRWDDSEQRWEMALAWVVAVGLGAGWQLVDRRDPTDRLVVIAVLFALAGFLLLLPGGEDPSVIREDSQHFALILPLISGVVLAEQWMRSRERKRSAARPAAVGAPD
jgi:hypothetical protein